MKLSLVTETRIAGESLFNDGIGVVVFLTLLGAKTTGAEVTLDSVGVLFFTEVIGGLALGAIVGYFGLKLVRYIENEHVELEVLITLALVLFVSVILFSCFDIYSLISFSICFSICFSVCFSVCFFVFFAL